MMMKKKRSNWRNEGKLLANRESKKVKSISITEKLPNLSNQITIITNGEHMDMDIVYPEAMGIQFDDQIIMEILKRLPVQSILRFKCVVKSWNALISDPYFKKEHLNHANNDQNCKKLLISKKCIGTDSFFSFYRSSLLSVEVVEDEEILYGPSTCEPVNSVLYCTCDGLVFLEVKDDRDKYFLLWNPSIRESELLPDPKSQLDRFVCGMAYDATSDDYKILAVDLNSEFMDAEMLALKSGSWKTIWKHPYGVRHTHCFGGCGMDSLAFVHGSFHWVGLSHCDTIVSFNISNEVYNSEIPLLEKMLNSPKPVLTNCGVSVLGGMLCFYSAYRDRSEGMFKCWVMKDYGIKESWTELLIIQDCFSFLSAIPIYKYADGEVLLRCIYNGSGGCIYRTTMYPVYSHNVGFGGSIYRTFRGYFGFGPIYDHTYKQGMVYTESLISPKLVTPAPY